MITLFQKSPLVDERTTEFYFQAPQKIRLENIFLIGPSAENYRIARVVIDSREIVPEMFDGVYVMREVVEQGQTYRAFVEYHYGYTGPVEMFALSTDLTLARSRETDN